MLQIIQKQTKGDIPMSKKKHKALQKQNLQTQEQTINKYKLDWQKIC